jgi:8-oxo-dGTP pyrophosphatase MutT (NUDIX family)
MKNHADTIIESVTKILIINNNQEALVLILGKHLKYPEKSYLPDLPGGIVEPGESEQIAALREAKEEAGIELDPQNVRLAFAETAFYPAEHKSVSKLLYIAQVDGTPAITLSWEHSDYKWVSLEDLESIAFRPFFKQAIEYSRVNKLL